MNSFNIFRNDPFFSGIDIPHAFALEYPSNSDARDRRISKREQQSNRQQDLDIFQNPFALMQNMMNEMQTTMNSHQFQGQIGEGVGFSSATVMSMDRSNGGEPRIFQATSEKLHGPEGFERTRKAVRDTGRHIEKMEIAHRLGQRGHRITKERDPNTGHLLENREFDHIDDENEFEREWFNRAEKFGLKNLHGNSFNSSDNRLLQSPQAFQRLRSQSLEPRRLAIEQKDRRKK